MGKKLKQVRKALHYWIVDPWLPDEEGGGDAPKKSTKKGRKAGKKKSKKNASKSRTTKAKINDFKNNLKENAPFRDTFRRVAKTLHYYIVDPWLPEVKPDPPAHYKEPEKAPKPSFKSRILSMMGMKETPKAPTGPPPKAYTVRRYGSVESLYSISSVLTEYHLSIYDAYADGPAGSLANYLMSGDEVVEEVKDTLDEFKAKTDGLAAVAENVEAMCNDMFKVTLCRWPATAAAEEGVA